MTTLKIGGSPEQEVKVGDIAIVSSPIPGAPDGREDLAAIHDTPASGGPVTVRFAFSLMTRWWFADPQPVARERILRLAPEDEQTAAMRATLAAEGRAA